MFTTAQAQQVDWKHTLSPSASHPPGRERKFGLGIAISDSRCQSPVLGNLTGTSFAPELLVSQPHPPAFITYVGSDSRSAVAYESAPTQWGVGRFTHSCTARAHGLEQVHTRRAETTPHMLRHWTVSPSSAVRAVHGSRAAAIPQPACFDSRPGGRKKLGHTWFAIWLCHPPRVLDLHANTRCCRSDQGRSILQNRVFAGRC